jgi:ketosteroid isomerase-like protein
MPKKLAALGLSLVLVVVAVVVNPPSASATLSGNGNRCERQFNDTVQRFDEAFLAKELDKFVSFYGNDATIVSTAGRIFDTKEEIRANFAGLFALDFIATFSTIRQVVRGCTAGTVVSDFVLEIPSANVRVHFVNTITFTRQHGRWRVLLDQSTPLPA